MAERNPKTGRFPKGNGAGAGRGWGGEAKGASTAPRFSADDEYRGMATTENRLAAIADRTEILGFYTEVLRDRGESTVNRMTAGEKILDRTEGKPAATHLLGGASDAPPVPFKVILEDLTTDASSEGQEAASTAGPD